MVILSAAILTQSGKTLLARQYFDVTRVRIEGLLSAFPKLMGTGRQYTYFETDTVRYVYQPLETMYLVLITNKNSNIIEDLETLRLLGRLIPESCVSISEEEISKKLFEICFAFDEAIHMGYRDPSTIEDIKNYLRMQSDFEVLSVAVENDKIRRAQEERDEFIKRAKKNALPTTSISHLNYQESLAGQFGTQGSTPTAVQPAEQHQPKDTGVGGSGMRLGNQKKGKVGLLNSMVKTGEIDSLPQAAEGAAAGGKTVPKVSTGGYKGENVHVKIEEKLVAQLDREGAVQNVDIKGDFYLTVGTAAYQDIRVQLNHLNQRDFTWKTHPCVNRNSFVNDNLLVAKDPTKPFPVGVPQGLLKWRIASKDYKMPITITLWPSDDSCNLEFETTSPDVSLNDVVITIPIGNSTPNVTSMDCGTFQIHQGQIAWVVGKVDSSNSSGAIEISLDEPADTFPISVNFTSDNTISKIKVNEVIAQNGQPAPFSLEVSVGVENYTIGN